MDTIARIRREFSIRGKTIKEIAHKPRCSPNMPARKLLRSIQEGARDMARDIAQTDAYVVSRRERKKVEMLFAHLKRILNLDRLGYAVQTAPETSSTSPQ